MLDVSNLVFQNQDEVNLGENKTITKQFVPGETVILSCKVNKHNKNGVIQQRLLLVTSHYIYNIDHNDLLIQIIKIVKPNSVIKRKIAIQNLAAFTVSSYYLSDQFVIHVEREHDYRYSGIGKKRNNIISAICYAFRNKVGRKIPFHFKEELDLGKFQTHEDDVRCKHNKRPKDAAVLLSDEDLKSCGLDYIIKNRLQGSIHDNSRSQESPYDDKERNFETNYNSNYVNSNPHSNQFRNANPSQGDTNLFVTHQPEQSRETANFHRAS